MLSVHEAIAIFVLKFGGQLVHLDMATGVFDKLVGSNPATPMSMYGLSVVENTL